MHTKYRSENLGRRGHCGDPGVDGKIIKEIREIMAEGRVQWGALVIMVIKILVP
jgi:hypothetical protein